MATPIDDEFAPKKAVKSAVYLKIAGQGPSGSGKTDGLLAFATNFLIASGKDPAVDRILVVDTENDSASLYADRYDFDTISLRAPYTSERYKKAMHRAIVGKYAILIVDGITPQWSGDGGILRRKDLMDAGGSQAGGSKSSYNNWAKFDPEYESFVEFIKQIPIDTIVTMRTKQAYALESVNGKQTPRKIGMAPVQRDGMEYEFSIVFEIDMQHKARLSKSRLKGVFEEDEALDLMDQAVAIRVREWRDSGAEMIPSEWKPQLADKKREEPVSTSERAKAPLMITEGDRLFFWDTAQKSGYTNDQIKTYLQTTLKVENSKMIPAKDFQTIISWAHTAAPPQTFAPGEEKAREAAKILNLTERDIQDELTEAKGDWEAVYASINSNVDAEAAAAEATK